jgi:hypothetical protein
MFKQLNHDLNRLKSQKQENCWQKVLLLLAGLYGRRQVAFSL